MRFLALRDGSDVDKEQTPATLEINIFILQQPRLGKITENESKIHCLTRRKGSQHSAGKGTQG